MKKTVPCRALLQILYTAINSVENYLTVWMIELLKLVKSINAANFPLMTHTYFAILEKSTVNQGQPKLALKTVDPTQTIT